MPHKIFPNSRTPLLDRAEVILQSSRPDEDWTVDFEIGESDCNDSPVVRAVLIGDRNRWRQIARLSSRFPIRLAVGS